MVHKNDENKLSFLMRENGLISYTSDALEFSQLKTLLFTILYDTCYVLYQQLPIFGSTIPTMPRVTRVMSLHVLISYQLWLYIWPPLYLYTHTLILSDCHSLAPSLSYQSIFFFQNLHPHHDPPRKDRRSSEYLEQERRYYKSYSSSSLLYHLFFLVGFLLSFVFSF